MLGDVVQVQRLRGRARAQVGAARDEHGRVLVAHRAVAGQRELHHGRVDGALGDLVQRLQHLHGALRRGLGAVDLELLVAVRDLHAQGVLDAAQVRIQRAAQVAEARIVQGGKGVSQNHAGHFKEKGHP
ncbi:hypothetical protein D9M69_513960 [compost metagenome]